MMRTKTTAIRLFIFLLFSVMLCACSSEETEKVIGTSISITLGKEGGTQKIEVGSKSWWINGVKLDGVDLWIDPTVEYFKDEYECTVKVEAASFLIEKNGSELIVRLSSIKEAEERMLEITLQEQNAFGVVRVCQ